MRTIRRAVALVLTVVLTFCCVAQGVHAEQAEQTEGGKYVKDVFIAYGKTEKDAKDWLIANNWEPISGNADFCAGKDSFWDKSIAAVMGIRRTDDKDLAIKDMAVMNMTGGYSFPDYEALLEEKKSEIDEYINVFFPIIREYRQNYENEGSKLGKKRADLARDILNRFLDGDPDDRYAVNDTGKPLGDLFLATTMQEGGGKGSGDLQQIFLESTEAANMAVSMALAIAADAGQETWLQRLAGLTGTELEKNLPKYVPEAAGQELPGSAVKQFLRLYFKDTAVHLARQWYDINEIMTWYESYNDKNNLWSGDNESDEAYKARVEAYFASLSSTMDELEIAEERNRYDSAAVLYFALYEIPYQGDWGKTLGDFFNPYNGTKYGEDVDQFLTFAAALSPGQRAAADLLPLRLLLLIGTTTEDGVASLFEDVEAMLGSKDKKVSVYSGVNRGIFRGGVALTSAALMEKANHDPYSDLFSVYSAYNIVTYSAAILSVPFLAAGISLWRSAKWPAECNLSFDKIKHTADVWRKGMDNLEHAKLMYEIGDPTYRDLGRGYYEEVLKTIQKDKPLTDKYIKRLEEAQAYRRKAIPGKILTAVGAALLLSAAFAKGYQLYRYYQKDFTPIPLLIVDEADIVTYITDSDGKTVKKIDFDQYVYYTAVPCNRQEMGEISDWQSGVSDYASWGCGDVADLNGDFGQEWLALYTVTSPKKGNPILADSLTLQYGSDKQPAGTSKKLHLFTFTNAVDIGDTAWSYNNDKDGVYFFWEEDANAFNTTNTASAFTRGQLAITGVGGLLLGILGTTLVLSPRRRKRKEDDPAPTQA